MKVLQTLVLIFGLSVFANAQKIALSGVIYDSQGFVIVGATIKATNKKGENFETKSNDEGIYTINLSPEFYKISIKQAGFIKLIINNLKIVNSTYGKINQDIVLEVHTSNKHEPCGYGGADCLNLSTIKSKKSKTSNRIFQKPLKKLPEKQNKSKRKI